MPGSRSGSAACPDSARRRLAVQLADMIPGAASVRVSVSDQRVGFRPFATARDAGGRPLEVSRTTARVAARWILRVWPEADWRVPQILDLATATLACGWSGAECGGR